MEKKPLSVFQVHAPGTTHETVNKDTAFSLIYIDDCTFFKIIDVAILTNGDSHTGFIRVSGHKPVDYRNTFDPSDLGPFRVLG